MIKVTKGLLWQWDSGRKVEIIPKDDFVVDEVHYHNGTTSTALICDVHINDGKYESAIPNILLQSSNMLSVYAVMENGNGTRTIEGARFNVICRAKPDDYVYTETELKQYRNIAQEATKQLEENNTQMAIVEEKMDNVLNAIGTPEYTDFVLFLAKNDMLVAVEEDDGAILTDENGNVLIW